MRATCAQVKRLAALEDKGVFVLECRLDDGRVAREIASSVGDDRWTQWRETYGESRTPLLLFGAGHVGRALVLALRRCPSTYAGSTAGRMPFRRMFPRMRGRS